MFPVNTFWSHVFKPHSTNQLGLGCQAAVAQELTSQAVSKNIHKNVSR